MAEENQVFLYQSFKSPDGKCDVDFYPNFMPLEEAEAIMGILEERAPWPASKNYRRVCLIYGDSGLVYSSSYRERKYEDLVLPWDEMPVLEPIKDMVEKATGLLINCCAVMRYPNGKRGIKPHRDREISDAPICGISLGATREISFLPTFRTVFKAPISITLNPGSLYVMNPPTNDYCLHTIPEDETVTPRISLTFRSFARKE